MRFEMLSAEKLEEAVRRMEELAGHAASRHLERGRERPYWAVTIVAQYVLPAWVCGVRAQWDDLADRVGHGWLTTGREAGGQALGGDVLVTFTVFGEAA